MKPMNFLRRGATLLALAMCGVAGAQTPPATPAKVLKVAFRSAETGFDPSMISDLYSRTITPHIFEALYKYDHLARPAKIVPLTAIGMPEVSADFKTWTVRIQPGIYFASDPAFKGQKREMVEQDYVYAFQRIADPINKSQLWSWVETFGLVGLAEYRQEILAAKKPFDYERAIEGVRAIDRHTIQFKLKEARPRFITSIAGSDLLGAQAREVVEFYGDKIAEHPVGTGPFRLKQWRRSSLIVLERNPDYRDVRYDAEPAADDAEGQAILARLKGRKLPMIDEVRISIIEGAAVLALVPQRSARRDRRPDRRRAGRVHHRGHAQRQDRALPGQARHPGAAAGQLRQRARVLQHGGPGGGRLHA
jgi:ABC-type transport system substrate-binding protein